MRGRQTFADSAIDNRALLSIIQQSQQSVRRDDGTTGRRDGGSQAGRDTFIGMQQRKTIVRPRDYQYCTTGRAIWGNIHFDHRYYILLYTAKSTNSIFL